MIKRIMLFAVLCLTVLFAACGGGSGGSDNSDPGAANNGGNGAGSSSEEPPEDCQICEIPFTGPPIDSDITEPYYFIGGQGGVMYSQDDKTDVRIAIHGVLTPQGFLWLWSDARDTRTGEQHNNYLQFIAHMKDSGTKRLNGDMYLYDTIESDDVVDEPSNHGQSSDRSEFINIGTAFLDFSDGTSNQGSDAPVTGYISIGDKLDVENRLDFVLEFDEYAIRPSTSGASEDYISQGGTHYLYFDDTLLEIQFDDMNGITGNSSAGCVISGSYFVPDSNQNIYGMDVLLKNCSDAGSYQGIGYLSGLTPSKVAQEDYRYAKLNMVLFNEHRVLSMRHF